MLRSSFQFVVWSHVREWLHEFLRHLQGILQNIRFTMEMEKNGTLPLMDVLVTRKVDDTLGHEVYRYIDVYSI
jgi:hypothetical protein